MGNMSGSAQDDSDSDSIDMEGFSDEMLGENYLVLVFRQLMESGELFGLSTEYEEHLFHNSRLPVIKKKANLDILQKSQIYQSIREASGLKANNIQDDSKWNLLKLISNRQNGVGQVGGPFKNSEKVKINNLFLPTSSKHLIVVSGSKAFCGLYSKEGDYFISASQDASIRIFDAKTSYYRQINQINAKHVNWCILDINFSPNNNEYYCYSTWSDCLHICPIDGNSTDIQCLRLNSDIQRFAAFSSAFSNCGKEIIAGCNDGCLYVYDILSDRRALKVPVCENADVNAVGFIDDTSQIFYSGSDDGIIKIWDKRCLKESDPQPAGILVGHYDGITYIDSKNDGRYLISNSKDQSIKLWDIRLFSPKEAEDAALEKFSTSIAWDYRWDRIPKKYYNVSKSLDGDTSVVTYRGHRVQKTLMRARFSPDTTTGQRYIYTGCGTGRLVIYDVLTGKIVKAIKGHQDIVRDVAWHPRRSEILTTSWDSYINIVTPSRESEKEPRNTKRNRSGDPLRRSKRIAQRTNISNSEIQ